MFPSRTARGAVNEGDFESYSYDDAGNRLTLRKRDGFTLSYQYDNLNRMTRKTVPNRTDLASTHERDVFYAWDVRGLMTEARFDSLAGEGVTNIYDGFGRLTSSRLDMDGPPRTLLYGYDPAGRRESLTYPGGQVFTYQHDPAGRLTGVYQGAGTTTPLVTFTYNAQGLPARRTNGGGSRVDYTYSPIGRLTRQVDTFVGGTGNVTINLGYNVPGQIVTRTRNNDAYASTTAYDVSRAYEANGLNQYRRTLTSGTPSATFSYDANGNLTGDGAATFTYDVENRLVAAGGSRSATLRYDPLGRLYEVTGPTGTITRFLWDGDALVGEYNAAGTMTARYVHGTSAGDDPLLWSGGGVTRWLHPDHQGSIVAVAGGAGAISAINAYDSWGIPNATNEGRFQYTGQIWLADMGLYHYKGRMYSPTLGRFMQVDPVGYEGGINLYAYVENDPVNRVDPDGRQVVVQNGAQENFLRGIFSYPADLYAEVRQAVALTGLAGLEARNRALLVDAMAARALTWIDRNRSQALEIAEILAWDNKAFITGRILLGLGVGSRTGPLAGGALGLAAASGGGVRALTNVANALEANQINTDGFSGRTLASIYAAGALGGNVRFNARTGNITVTTRSQETGSRLERTQTRVVCNVRTNC